MEASEETYSYALAIFFSGLTSVLVLESVLVSQEVEAISSTGVLPNITSQGTVRRKNSCEGTSTTACSLFP